MDPGNPNRRILLSNGNAMPIIGLGMYLSADENEVEKSILSALEGGYRHFDTAFLYQNEDYMGRVFNKVLQEKKVTREDLFITSKLPPNGLNPKDVAYFFKKSLKSLQLSYLDLYLIHNPVATKRSDDDYDFFPTKNGVLDADMTVDFLETWKVLEGLVEEGLVKSIGLSNFNSEQIRKIFKSARIKPTVLQIECHAYNSQVQLQDLCKELKMALTAYSPIGAPGSLGGDEPLIKDPRLVPICKKYGKSPAQVLLRYLIQRDIIVIPKSTNPKRIQENIQIFDFTLSDDDMTTLKSMNRNQRLFKFERLADHPEYPFKIPF